jgi:hypothetical protein
MHHLAPTRNSKEFCTLNLEDQIVLYLLQPYSLNDYLNLKTVVDPLYIEFL